MNTINQQPCRVRPRAPKNWGPSATLPSASYRTLTLRPAAALPQFLTARSPSDHRHSAHAMPTWEKARKTFRHVPTHEALANHLLKP